MTCLGVRGKAKRTTGHQADLCLPSRRCLRISRSLENRMLKGNHGNKGQRAARGHKKFALATVAATILLGTTGAWSQVMAPSMQSPQSVLGTTSVLSATPLSLARAIELAMESNPEVAAATRQVEASEGQVIQGRVRPNPELAYSLEDTAGCLGCGQTGARALRCPEVAHCAGSRWPVAHRH